VLHTKGSHFDYKRRYPPEFAHFVTQQGTKRNKIVDTYDDSILYTDWFLSELISILSARNSHTALLYASDHGENLLDDDRQLLGHTKGTKYDLSTSSFIWVSEGVRQRHPNWVSNAVQNAALPLSLSNLPHSVLELADIRVPAMDPQMSIFSPTFVLHPRSYLQGGAIRPEPAALMAPN
jgi:heptose-I-phosphate ethanolaminephosphotransferase